MSASDSEWISIVKKILALEQLEYKAIGSTRGRYRCYDIVLYNSQQTTRSTLHKSKKCGMELCPRVNKPEIDKNLK